MVRFTAGLGNGNKTMSILKKAIAVLNAVDEEQDFLPDNAAYVHALQSKGLLAPEPLEQEEES